MKPNLVDHVFAFTIILLLPILSVWTYRAMMARLRADPSVRWRAYLGLIVSQWSFTAILLGAWFAAGRDHTAIGFGLPLGVRSIIGLAFTMVIVAALALQAVAIRRGGDAARNSVYAQIADVQELLPRTPSEARWFRALAVTAGVCEEVMYRGFLIAYLAVLLGAWPAVAASSAMFGVAHAYQGRANALKGAGFGLLTGALYVGCGSLVWPMIIHAAIDLHGGALGRFALEDREPSDRAPDSSPITPPRR